MFGDFDMTWAATTAPQSTPSLAEMMETMKQLRAKAKTVAACFKMSAETWTIVRAELPEAQVASSHPFGFPGESLASIRVIEDADVPFGLVRAYNCDDELLQEIEVVKNLLPEWMRFK
jgi:hypothetical protein